MSSLKVVYPHIQRKNIVLFSRIKPTLTAEDKKNIFYPILVKFRLFEQMV